MKHLLYLFLLLAIISCKSKKVELVNAKEVESAMTYLASDELAGRATGSEGIEKAAVYIEKTFKESGLKPYFEAYRDTFYIKSRDTLNPKDIIGYNVIGYIEGNDSKLKDEFVILGAHYDHIGYARKVDGDSIANGANDDASGTVAVLEWAKYFAKKNNNKRSVIFALYAGEEMGLKGSQDLAKRLKENDMNLYTMINFEMIGVPRSSDVSMAYITGYEKSNIAEKLNQYAGDTIIGFLETAKQYQLFFRSDNYSFYKEFKIPAHAISTFDFTNFEHYHKVGDEADIMDYDHMTKFMNKMIPAIEGMMNSTTKEIQMNNE